MVLLIAVEGAPNAGQEDQEDNTHLASSDSSPSSSSDGKHETSVGTDEYDGLTPADTEYAGGSTHEEGGEESGQTHVDGGEELGEENEEEHDKTEGDRENVENSEDDKNEGGNVDQETPDKTEDPSADKKVKNSRKKKVIRKMKKLARKQVIQKASNMAGAQYDDSNSEENPIIKKVAVLMRDAAIRKLGQQLVNKPLHAAVNHLKTKMDSFEPQEGGLATRGLDANKDQVIATELSFKILDK